MIEDDELFDPVWHARDNGQHAPRVQAINGPIDPIKRWMSGYGGRYSGQITTYRDWLAQVRRDGLDKPFTPAPTHDLEALEKWLAEED